MIFPVSFSLAGFHARRSSICDQRSSRLSCQFNSQLPGREFSEIDAETVYGTSSLGRFGRVRGWEGEEEGEDELLEDTDDTKESMDGVGENAPERG